LVWVLVWGIFLECEVSLMASWFAAEMRTEFCERPDHIAEPSNHTAAYDFKLNGPHFRLCFDHGGNPGHPSAHLVLEAPSSLFAQRSSQGRGQFDFVTAIRVATSAGVL
jgi:hypothetical protein